MVCNEWLVQSQWMVCATSVNYLRDLNSPPPPPPLPPSTATIPPPSTAPPPPHRPSTAPPHSPPLHHPLTLNPSTHPLSSQLASLHPLKHNITTYIKDNVSAYRFPVHIILLILMLMYLATPGEYDTTLSSSYR